MRFGLLIQLLLVATIPAWQPVVAQSTETQQVPPASGYEEPELVDPDLPLIEQQRPEILDYDIPVYRRGDLSSCQADATYQLDDVIKTCWPILQAAQLFVQLEFAVYEAKESLRKNKDNIASNKVKALKFAEQLKGLIGEPKFPLEHYYLEKNYRAKGQLHAAFDEHKQALQATNKRVDLLIHMPVYDMEFHLAFAWHDRTKYLLELGRRDEARENFEASFPLLFTRSGYKNGLPISNHSETIITDALHNGDNAFALSSINRYLAVARNMDKGMQFGLIEHIDLKIYMLAGRGQVKGVMALINERNTEYGDIYSRCPIVGRYFPYVVAPLHKNPKIAAKLSAMKCSAKSLAKMDEVAGNGIFSYNGKTLLLPARSETRTSK
ncbi:MAG: hypothetical protein ABJP02_06055 [Parasphingorhabdus sp.]|uniref:hypothetical protein n=1 Tax=Parasphingorhabdus sp. TaxID=2709688 RepID=UPI0032977829